MEAEATYNCGGDDVAYVVPQMLNCLPASHGRRVSHIGRRICYSFCFYELSGQCPSGARQNER